MSGPEELEERSYNYLDDDRLYKLRTDGSGKQRLTAPVDCDSDLAKDFDVQQTYFKRG